MRILKGVEIPVTICVSYTVLSIANAVFSLFAGRTEGTHWNSIVMLLWTSIAVFVLSIHHLFDEWSPALMIVVQYMIAMGLVFLTVFIGSFFEEVSEGGYFDVFVSFTWPYVIGALLYYISLFRSAKRQDRMIQEINGRSN